MTALVNSHQPISRMPPAIVVMIIKAETAELGHGQDSEKFWRKRQPDFQSWKELNIAQITRCAQLRRVYRAWRDVIDGTPEFTRYIVVDGWRNNVQYALRYNHGSLLECFLPFRDATALEPLKHRQLNIYSTDVPNVGLALFPMLRVIRISGTEVGYTRGFILELVDMLHFNPNLTELILDTLTTRDFVNEHVEDFLDLPRPRPDHPGLQRVQITGISSPLRSMILRSLGLQTSVTLIVDHINPDDLLCPDSVAGNIIRSLGRTEFSTVYRGQMAVTGYPISSAHGRANLIRFTWSRSGDTLPVDPPGNGDEALREFSKLESGPLTNSEAIDMARVLLASGIAVGAVELCADLGFDTLHHSGFIHCRLEQREALLRCMSSVKNLIIGQAAVGWFFPLMMRPTPGELVGYHQFLCPNLTQLEVSSHRTGVWGGILAYVRGFILWRQTAANSTRMPAKLQKIGLPFRNALTDPIFDGIETYLVN